jgi:uracil permease
VALNLILPCKDCNDPLPDEVNPSGPDHHTDL